MTHFRTETEHGKTTAKVRVLDENNGEHFTAIVWDPHGMEGWGTLIPVNEPTITWPSLGSVSPALAAAAAEAISLAAKVAHARAREAAFEILRARGQQ